MDLVVERLTAAYPGRTAVRAVELTVRAGEVVAIVGPNGCGRSTLLRCVARLHRPAAGRVLVGGQDVWKLRPRRRGASRRSPAPGPRRARGDHGGRARRVWPHPHQGLFRQWSPDDAEAVAHALDATGVRDLAGRRVDQLSGGQRQRAWGRDGPGPADARGAAGRAHERARPRPPGRAARRDPRRGAGRTGRRDGAARPRLGRTLRRQARGHAGGARRRLRSPARRPRRRARPDPLRHRRRRPAGPGDGAPMVVPAIRRAQAAAASTSRSSKRR
jgi:hypothetical protein